MYNLEQLYYFMSIIYFISCPGIRVYRVQQLYYFTFMVHVWPCVDLIYLIIRYILHLQYVFCPDLQGKNDIFVHTYGDPSKSKMCRIGITCSRHEIQGENSLNMDVWFLL